MKKIITLTVAVAALLFAGCAVCNNQSNAPKQPRKVAVQSYSLNRFTLEDSVKKLAPLNLDGIECYPGQKLSAKYPNVKVGPKMNAEQRAYMKKLLKDANLKFISFGVTHARSEAEIDATCQFVKEMGGERVLTEAPVYWIPFWDKACKKYGLTMCLHHHGVNAGNQYWDTCVMKKYIKGFDNVKANPDPGHWSRSGIDPVKALKQLDGYVASIHLKDHARGGSVLGKTVVPFGEGEIDMKGILAELDRQGYKGYYVIEYEGDWDNNIPQIKKCVEYLRTH